MYQTKFDRWLRETFIYEHHIKVVHLPEKIPRGVTVSEIKSVQYHYLLVAKNKNKASQLIEYLADTGSVYSTKIIEGNHWYNLFINNKKKSFTFRVFWWIVVIILAFFVYTNFSVFLQSDFYFELKKDFLEVMSSSS